MLEVKNHYFKTMGIPRKKTVAELAEENAPVVIEEIVPEVIVEVIPEVVENIIPEVKKTKESSKRNKGFMSKIFGKK